MNRAEFTNKIREIIDLDIKVKTELYVFRLTPGTKDKRVKDKMNISTVGKPLKLVDPEDWIVETDAANNN